MAACSIQATLANILQRLRVVEDNQSRSNAAIAKLRLEMEDGSTRIQELEFSHESSLREINGLLQRFGEQMVASRRKEQENLRASFARLREEIEEERNTCRLLKLRNKKLMKELEEASMAAADAGEQLDRERQARELMEEVCNELAREIREDKAEVEQLKQEQAKSKEKVEEEMKIMRMASLWKNERVKTKISAAQLELGDKHHMDMPLDELKSQVEDFVSTISAAGCESRKVPNNVCLDNKDEKQKIIEQARLLRCALEASMRQVAHNGGVLQVQTDMGFKEEKITTPIIEDRHTQTDVCDCCFDEVYECEHDRSRNFNDDVELRAESGNCTVNYSNKPGKDIRRPQMVVEDDLFEHSANIILQARNHLHNSNVETEEEGGSRRIMLNTEYVQAPNQSPSPESFFYEGGKSRLLASKHNKQQRPQVVVSRSGRGEVQSNESGFHCGLSSKHTSSLDGGAHQKQLSIHFEASQNRIEANADVWEDDLTPNARRVNRFSEDDVSPAFMDDEGRFSMHRQGRKGCPTFSACSLKQVNAIYPWKSLGIREEHMRDGDFMDNNGECLMHHEYEDAKSLCADGAESGEDERGEFDGFYFEPVVDDGLLEDDCGTHCQQEPDVADHDDEHGDAISNPYSRSGSSPIKLTESLPHDGGEQTNAISNGTPAKSSGKGEQLLLSPPPLHTLVLPTLSATRVPSVKSQYSSPRRAARSLSPSRPQVLQCFRPTPTSPEHDSTKVAVLPVSSKGAMKGDEHSGGNTSRANLLRASSNNRACEEEAAHHVSAEQLGEEWQGKEGYGSSRGPMEDKGNSLRAELLKARELDVKHVNYSLNNKSRAAEAPLPNKSSSSSFRFSPLRRSLTSTSQAGR